MRPDVNAKGAAEQNEVTKKTDAVRFMTPLTRNKGFAIT